MGIRSVKLGEWISGEYDVGEVLVQSCWDVGDIETVMLKLNNRSVKCEDVEANCFRSLEWMQSQFEFRSNPPFFKLAHYHNLLSIC